MSISVLSFIFPLQCKIIFTIDKYNNIHAMALTKGEIIVTLNAISGFVGIIEKILPRSR